MRIFCYCILFLFSCSAESKKEENLSRDTSNLNSFYEPIHTPKADSWISLHQEPIQTFSDFKKIKNCKINKVNLIKIGVLTTPKDSIIKTMGNYLSIFYNLDYSGITNLDLTKLPDSIFKHEKIKSTEMLHFLASDSSDSSSLALGICQNQLQLYKNIPPIFGQASYEQQVGVISFEQPSKMRNGKPNLKLLELRMLKIASHEMGHLMGMSHCQTYQCNMNGVNHLRELDSKPAYLCPNCLKKTGWRQRTDYLDRFEKLELFWEARNRRLKKHYELLKDKHNPIPKTQE